MKTKQPRYKRVNISLFEPQIKKLDKIAEQESSDRSKELRRMIDADAKKKGIRIKEA